VVDIESFRRRLARLQLSHLFFCGADS